MLSTFASREITEGRLAELEMLQRVTNASPLHHGSTHVIRLLHEFTFESFVGHHICFVTDALSYSVSSLKGFLTDPRLPLRLILGLTKQVLKGLEYLHEECGIIHSGMVLIHYFARCLIVPFYLTACHRLKAWEHPSAAIRCGRHYHARNS